MIYKTLQRKLTIEQHEPNKNTNGEHMCYERVRSFCSTSDTHHVTSVKILMLQKLLTFCWKSV